MRTLALSCVVLSFAVSAAVGQPATSTERPTAVQGEAAGQAPAGAQGGNRAQAGNGEEAWQPGTLARSELPTSRAFDYEFEDVQISTILGWLRRVGVEPPVRLGGRVTGWVWAQAPARGWWRLGDYRVEGELTSPLLDIDRYAIRHADVRFGYYQNNWTIGRAAGQVESVDPKTDDRRVLGQAHLDGRLPMSRTAPVRIAGTLREVSLLDLLLTLGLTASVPQGNAQGDFVIDTTIAQLSQPLRWNARGTISASDVRFGNLPTLALQTDWQLASARLSLTRARTTLAGQTLELAAELGLTGPFAWSVQLPAQAVVLAPELYQAFQMAVSPLLPLGTVQLSASSSGQLAPWRAQYAAQLGAQQLSWYGNNLANLNTALALNPTGLRIDSLSAQVAGGSVTGQVQWPTAPTLPVTASLNFQQVNLAQLSIPVEVPPMTGIVSGSAQAAIDASKKVDLQHASLDVRGVGVDVRIGDFGLGQVGYTLSKNVGADVLAVAVDSQEAGGTIAAQVQWPISQPAAEPAAEPAAGPTPVTASVNFQNVNLAQLSIPAQLPPMAGIVSGTAQATLDRSRPTDLRNAALNVRGTGANVRVGDFDLGQITYAANKTGDADTLALSLGAQMATGSIASRIDWPTGEANSVTASVNYQGVNLAQLRGLAQLPPMAGIVSGTAQATLDRSQLTDLRNAALNVRGTGANVRTGDIDLGQINYTANKDANADTVALSLDAQVAGGTVAGQAQWPTVANKSLTATVNYQRVNLAQLTVPADLPRMVGIVSGTAQATLDPARLTELQPAALDVRGDGAGVRIGDWGFGRVTYTVGKDAGADAIALSLADMATRPRWTGEGTVAPIENGNWTYDIRATADRLDLSFAQLMRLVAPKTEMPVPIAVVLATGKLAFRGDSAQGLTATAFDLSSVEAVQRSGSRWAIGTLAGRTSPTLIEIDRGDFQVGAGTIKVATTWHRAGEGTDRVQLDMKNFSIATLRGWGVSVLPVEVAGQASVDLNVQRPAGRPSWLVGWVGGLAMTVKDLAVRGQPVGTLTATGDLNAERWQTQVTGEVFQAPLSGGVEVLIAHQPDWKVSGIRGTLRWLGGAAERMIALWQGPQKANRWRGTANVRAEIDWQLEGNRSGFVRVDVPQLTYRGRSIARDFTFNAQLENDRVRLVRLDGGVAGGRVDASGNYDIAQERASGVVVNFQRVSLEEVVQLYDPDMAAKVKGRADLRVRVRVAQGIDMHGVLSLNDTVWYGVPVSEAHSDFELNASPDYSIVRVHAANIRGRGLGGRLDGDLTAHLDSRRSFESRVRIRRGEVEQLSKLIGTTSVIGKGKFDADLQLGAKRLATANDLQGRLDLSFSDTDAQTLPVADQLARFVPLFGIPSTEFERGRVVGFISRGALRMRSLVLWGPQLSVLGTGNVGLSSGRLDLQLVIRVGGGLTEQIAANYLAQLAATAVPPVELILQINRLVANRAIFLRVGGTASKPVIQPQAGRMLEQALLRSLLEQVAPVAAAATSPVARLP